MTTPDPAAIARGLEKDEAKILQCLQPNHRHLLATFYPTMQRLKRKSLVDVWYEDEIGICARLAPLGVAVREEIQREKGRV